MPLKIVRRPKSPHWIIRGTLRGIRVEETTGVADRRQAEEIRAKREAQLLAESVYGRRATSTFGEAALSYLEHGGSKRFLKPLVSLFATMPLARITQDALDAGALKLFPKAKGSTHNRQFYTPAAAVLRHAAKRGWCALPIIERPEAGAERVRYLSIEEADRLIDECADHLRPLVIFMFYTGARVSEALWLDWRNVDLSRAHVSFHNTKSGTPRGGNLHPRVVAALANIPGKDGEVFRTPDGRPYSRPRHREDTSGGSRIKTAFKAACRRARISDFHPHDCRHTWATWHYAVNRDLGALQILGGWKSVRMVLRYAHVNVAELADTINRLPGGNFGDATIGREKIA